jgi:hypothetical protein
VVLARLEAVCCTGERAILYVGIEERGAAHFDFREPPSGAVLLPEDVIETYREFLRSFESAARAGNLAEDLSQGHPLAADPAVRANQERFAAIAAERAELLRQVLRESLNPEHRAVAAAILGYAPRKPAVAPDLQYAMKDPDESVRANAMRALAAMAELEGVRVEATWFVEMLNSIVWSDRYRASQALVNLTASRPEGVLTHLRETALAALLEMARWRTPAHARPAFTILGRLARMTDGEIAAAWERDRAGLFKRFGGK